jgi:WD40 repeat protein
MGILNLSLERSPSGLHFSLSLMSLCINPHCLYPNHPDNDSQLVCQSCGSTLVLQGHYRVLRLLNDQSGFGSVYEAFERNIPKILKVLKPDYSNSAKAIVLFQQEASVLSQFDHPGIPAIDPNGYFQVVPQDDGGKLHCIIMEKIDGPNLREWMIQQGGHPISEQQAIQWLTQLTEILALVHQQNYFHRDIKPENIMLRSTGQLVLVDFGTVREMTQTYLEQLGKTGGITRISSAGYTAPEQEKGQAVPQSDFYALGCTFLYLLTGKEPTDVSLYDYLNNRFTWRQFAPQVSPRFADLLDRLTASRVCDRPATPEAILTTLTEIHQTTATDQLANQFANQSEVPSISALLDSSPLLSHKSWVPWGKLALAVLTLAGVGYTLFNHLSQLQPSSTRPSVSPTATEAIASPLQLARTLTGHTSYVNCLTLSPDGETLASGGADRTIKIWNLATGQPLQTLKGHTSFVNAIAISPDGRFLASGSADQTIKIWDLTTAKELRTLRGHQGFINALDFSPDGQTLVSGSADQTLKVWNWGTGQIQRTLTGHQGFINSLVISPDGQTLVSASADKTVKVWSLAKGILVRTLEGHTGFVNAIAISPDGKTVMSSSADTTIRVWDLATGLPSRILTGHRNFVGPLWLSGDGKTLVSGGADQTLRVWNLEQGAIQQTYTSDDYEIRAFVVSSEHQTIGVGNGDKAIQVWHLP